jgi:hypothetical protein
VSRLHPRFGVRDCQVTDPGDPYVYPGTRSIHHDRAEWAERAARHLKAELKRADLTYGELAARLKKRGLKETKARIANKLTRATLLARFFLAALTAVGRENVALEVI